MACGGWEAGPDPGDLTWFEPDELATPAARLPLAGESPATGFPSPAADYEEDAIDLNRLLMPRPASTFLMRVSGDAMGAAGIHHGDLLIIDRSLGPRSGSVVVAVNAGRFVLRRLARNLAGIGWCLEAADPSLPPIPLATGDPDLLIWGVVLHAVHHLGSRLKPHATNANLHG